MVAVVCLTTSSHFLLFFVCKRQCLLIILCTEKEKNVKKNSTFTRRGKRTEFGDSLRFLLLIFDRQIQRYVFTLFVEYNSRPVLTSFSSFSFQGAYEWIATFSYNWTKMKVNLNHFWVVRFIMLYGCTTQQNFFNTLSIIKGDTSHTNIQFLHQPLKSRHSHVFE